MIDDNWRKVELQTELNKLENETLFAKMISNFFQSIEVNVLECSMRHMDLVSKI